MSRGGGHPAEEGVPEDSRSLRRVSRGFGYGVCPNHRDNHLCSPARRAGEHKKLSIAKPVKALELPNKLKTEQKSQGLHALAFFTPISHSSGNTFL